MLNKLPKMREADIKESEALCRKVAGSSCVSEERAFRMPVVIKARKGDNHMEVSLQHSIIRILWGTSQPVLWNSCRDITIIWDTHHISHF